MNKTWNFFRAGGFDQVQLSQVDDLISLKDLNQKLWMALACPVRGVFFEPKTLAYLDSDLDGYIRPPELIDSIDWMVSRLSQPALVEQAPLGLRLSDVKPDGPEGDVLCERHKELLSLLAKSEEEVITTQEFDAAQKAYFAQKNAVWLSKQVLPLGEASEVAWGILETVRAKVDDYFLRVSMAQYDQDSQNQLRGAATTWDAIAQMEILSPAVLSSLPLSKPRTDGVLVLTEGINPLWRSSMQDFRDRVVKPIVGDVDQISEIDWQTICFQMKEFGLWLNQKPSADEGDGPLLALEKLAYLTRDMFSFVNNFVSFPGFYRRSGLSTFQAGTLYVDNRSCDLTVQVSDVARHSSMASLSRLYLIYCDCVRLGQKMTIAAAMTAGDVDQLRVGRNAVFYDRLQQDWSATVVKILDQPISLRQAFWSPYKKTIQFIEMQIENWSNAKVKARENSLTQGVGNEKNILEKGGVAQAFDVGKFAGIFAAFGLALGALGTALAAVLSGLFALAFWKIPLVIIGIFFLISAPSVFLAWFKLRTRCLGPLLDANGWAINGQAAINIPFGTSLTQRAKLPEGAQRNIQDPFAQQSNNAWIYWILIAVAMILGGLVWRLWGINR